MPDDRIDESTRVSCPYQGCEGGEITERTETAHGYRISTRECWLCGGIGSVTVAIYGCYVMAKRPVLKPEDWP